MRSDKTFGIHFIARPNLKGTSTIYARIVVDKSRCELGLKQTIDKDDWNPNRGTAKPKTPELKRLNSYLEEVRAKLVSHYQQLDLDNELVTAEAVKSSYLGHGSDAAAPRMTLNKLVAMHNDMMQKVLQRGTMKNYYSTALYLKKYMALKFPSGDIYLKELNYQFITGFEFYIRNNPLKPGDPCTNNGTMKHMERLKKMVTWAYHNEWIDKDPLTAYKLKFKRHQMEFLDKEELDKVEGRELTDPMLRRVRDLFVFSCYTGLAYVDLFLLTPANIVSGGDGMKWILTARKKTDIAVNIPLLKPALVIMEKFQGDENASRWGTLFPRISNQEVNRALKLIGEICEVRKRMTFHLARHTFATTVTLMNGMPIETISKLLGHTKLATTMIYSHVMQTKVGMDMKVLQEKLN